MARPKTDDPRTSAVFKIETAFWGLLEKQDFSDITIQILAQEAGINRNSLYYHYANIQEVASSAFQNVVSDDWSLRFVDMLLSEPKDIMANWDVMGLSERIRKMHLFARSKSPLLRSLLEKTLIDRWFQKLNIRADELSPEAKLQVDYIANGFIGVLGNKNIADDPFLLSTFLENPIGRAAIQTLRQYSLASINA